MTEQKAIEQLKVGYLGDTEELVQAKHIAIKALEEIQQYRAMEEKLLEAKKNCGEDSDCSECPFGQIEDRCILQELQIEGGNNGWIPCSERLPEDEETVIFATEAGMVESGWYDANKNWCVNESYFPSAFLFIAWQPLPAPYKKGE